MANYDEIGSSFAEESFTLRTKIVHEYHLQALQESANNGPIYGVLRRCPLLGLAYFDVSTSFPPDIMHDLLEVLSNS